MSLFEMWKSLRLYAWNLLIKAHQILKRHNASRVVVNQNYYMKH